MMSIKTERHGMQDAINLEEVNDVYDYICAQY